MKKSIKISAAILVGLIIILGLSAWHPWERQPTVFYAPLLLPLETVDGDIIVMEDGFRIVIEGNRTIHSIEQKGDEIIVNSTRYISLWELLMTRAGRK